LGGGVERFVAGVEHERWRFIALVRLIPLFPFNLTNYALGVTRIGFVEYMVSSFIFMAPGAFAYTWLGYAGKEAVDGGEGMVKNGLIALSLLAATAFLPRLIKKRGLAESAEIEKGEDDPKS
jgi:uncharacterized membrane protein YdjX (TVP38/TMEM64 family)